MLEFLHLASQLLLVAAAILTLFRTVRGPTSYDRVLGLDTLALLLAGFLLLESRGGELRLFMDTALGLALLSFVGTVLFARTLGEGRGDV